MTVVGYVRGRQMRIYAGAERLLFPEAAQPEAGVALEVGG